MASAGLSVVSKYKLAGLVPISSIFSLSQKVGRSLGSPQA